MAVRESGDSQSALVRLKLAEPYPANWAIPKDQIVSPEGARFCFAFGYGASGDPRGQLPGDFARASCFAPMREPVG